MEAAEILATLAAIGDPDWLPDLTVPEEPEESPVQVLVASAVEADAEIPDDTSAETRIDAEIPGCTNEKSPIIIESSGSNSPVFDDATLEEVDIDLLIYGVTSLQETGWFTTWCSCWKEKWLETSKVDLHR